MAFATDAHLLKRVHYMGRLHGQSKNLRKGYLGQVLPNVQVRSNIAHCLAGDSP